MAWTGRKETGSFREKNATSRHPYRASPAIRTADPSRLRSKKIADADRHLEADGRLGEIVVTVDGTSQ
jgi:hypothetical protein